VSRRHAVIPRDSASPAIEHQNQAQPTAICNVNVEGPRQGPTMIVAGLRWGSSIVVVAPDRPGIQTRSCTT
jgi:hypothetical protein